MEITSKQVEEYFISIGLAETSIKSYISYIARFDDQEFFKRGRDYLNEYFAMTINDITELTGFQPRKGTRIRPNTSIVGRSAILKYLKYLLTRKDTPSEIKKLIQKGGLIEVHDRSKPLAKASPTYKQIKQLANSLYKLNRGVKGFELYVMCLTTFYLGVRLSELFGLTENDIYFEEGYVEVSHQYAKRRKGRRVPLVPMLAVILKKWVDYCKKNFPNYSSDDFLFCDFSKRTWQREIYKASKALGFKIHITPHTLRHAFTSYLHKKGVDVLDLQKILGHSDPSTTAIYIHEDTKSRDNRIKELFM